MALIDLVGRRGVERHADVIGTNHHPEQGATSWSGALRTQIGDNTGSNLRYFICTSPPARRSHSRPWCPQERCSCEIDRTGRATDNPLRSEAPEASRASTTNN